MGKVVVVVVSQAIGILLESNASAPGQAPAVDVRTRGLVPGYRWHRRAFSCSCFLWPR